VDRTLVQEILDVVEQAAIASAQLTGLGQKDEADAAAVEAMRKRMGTIQMQGRIVIGEGERDEAPMLYIGEEVGSGTGPGVDFAVDPCEGTNLCANSQRGSMAVLAASDRGGLFNAPDFYMNILIYNLYILIIGSLYLAFSFVLSVNGNSHFYNLFLFRTFLMLQ